VADDSATSEFALLEEALLPTSELVDDFSPLESLLESPQAVNAASITHSAARQRVLVGIVVGVDR
jgi:hypothetical protein